MSQFSIRKRLHSFSFAFKGIFYFLKTQHNALIHAVATVLVIAAGFVFGVSRTEWALLVLSMGIVWTAELFNTALELLTDLVSPGFHQQAGRIKDMAAGAVLTAAIAAAVIGMLVFVPKILCLFGF